VLELAARRTGQAVITVLLVTAVVFALLNSSGDPASLLVPPDAPIGQVDLLRRSLGLDRPLLTRYALFLRNAATGQFGASFRSRQPAIQTVIRHLENTAVLAGAALLLTTVVALPLGVLAGLYPGSPLDTFVTMFAVLGQSVPLFWLGMLAILLFAVQLHLLPPVGMGGVAHLILPAATLAWYSSAPLVRILRASMVEVLDQDYIRTARAKGLSLGVIVWKHALRNAAIPLITLWGLTAGDLLVGSVVTETVFAWPGLGRLTIMAVLGRDFPLVLAGVFVIALVFVIVNMLVDMSYVLVNPTIRFG
jgi:peptide/nickel transport system permease protein